ncbi:B-box zinc finger protein 20 [Camellia lanceoleosa]|uniref:B-box zinc finger protein 20 n=1 Tax=Camellia lanceoleosa TaxID=1840588 RepID=A0ACC0IZ24_9ERIC|nr:B-box zinc finger protein 20 [Camellia lanceoleosa]
MPTSSQENASVSVSSTLLPNNSLSVTFAKAILCKDCDIPIHKANEHTRNHDRFLLTGVKLSATSSLYSSQSSSDSFAANNDLLSNLKPQNSITTTTTNNKPSSL